MACSCNDVVSVRTEVGGDGMQLHDVVSVRTEVGGDGMQLQ